MPAREPALTAIRDVQLTGFRRQSAGSRAWLLAVLRVRAPIFSGGDWKLRLKLMPGLQTHSAFTKPAGVPLSSPVRLLLSGVGG